MKLKDVLFVKEIISKCLTLCQVCTDLNILPWNHHWSEEELNVLSKLIKDIYYAGKSIISANADLGYIVDNEDIIHCVTSSSWIWQFDGCKETEIKTQ